MKPDYNLPDDWGKEPSKEEWIADNRAQNIDCDKRQEESSPPWCHEMQEIAKYFQDLIPIPGIRLNVEYENKYKKYLRKAVDVSRKYGAPCKECTLNYLFGNYLFSLSDLSCGSPKDFEEERRYRENDTNPKDQYIESLFVELGR